MQDTLRLHDAKRFRWLKRRHVCLVLYESLGVASGDGEYTCANKITRGGVYIEKKDYSLLKQLTSISFQAEYWPKGGCRVGRSIRS